MVPDALIPPEGRTVKCGKCANQWHTEPAPEADFAALTQQAMDETPEPTMHDIPPARHPVPAVKRAPMSALPFKIAAPVLGVAWLVLALYAYFPSGQHGPLRGIYSAFGVTSTKGLVFADVAMERDMSGPRTRFILTGSIANHDAVMRTVPKVRVQLKDKDAKVVWERDYEVNEDVKPGAVYPFKIDDVETAFASSAASIVLDLGNNFELVMR